MLEVGLNWKVFVWGGKFLEGELSRVILHRGN